MRLRGGLSRRFNIWLAIVLLLLPTAAICFALATGAIDAMHVLASVVDSYFVGIVVGLPAFVLNRKALTESYGALDGKFFLSSQVALFGSRHGKLALVYFYIMVFLTVRSFPFLARIPGLEGAGGFIVQAMYLSANVLPFVFPPRRNPQ
jgi:hypothetical protein